MNVIELNKKMSNCKICLILFCILILMSSVITAIHKYEQISVINPEEERENFIAAVYEHLPVLALPVCYEKGTWFDFSYSK